VIGLQKRKLAKKEGQKTYQQCTGRRVSRRTVQRQQGCCARLEEKTELGTNKAQLNLTQHGNFELHRSTFPATFSFNSKLFFGSLN
jgi:hypothetical protein